MREEEPCTVAKHVRAARGLLSILGVRATSRSEVATVPDMVCDVWTSKRRD